MLNPLIHGNSISVYAHQTSPQLNDWIALMRDSLNPENRYLDKLTEIAQGVHEANQRFEYHKVKRDLSASTIDPTTASFDVVPLHQTSNGWVRRMNLRQCNCSTQFLSVETHKETTASLKLKSCDLRSRAG